MVEHNTVNIMINVRFILEASFMTQSIYLDNESFVLIEYLNN